MNTSISRLLGGCPGKRQMRGSSGRKINLALGCNLRNCFPFLRGVSFMLYYIEALLMCLLDFAFPKDRPLSHMDCCSSDDR